MAVGIGRLRRAMYRFGSHPAPHQYILAIRPMSRCSARRAMLPYRQGCSRPRRNLHRFRALDPTRTNRDRAGGSWTAAHRQAYSPQRGKQLWRSAIVSKNACANYRVRFRTSSSQARGGNQKAERGRTVYGSTRALGDLAKKPRPRLDGSSRGVQWATGSDRNRGCVLDRGLP